MHMQLVHCTSLQDEEKTSVLDLLVNHDLAMEDVSKKIQELKCWRCTKEAFVNRMHVDSWEEAQQKFPLYAQKKRLLKFNLKSDNTKSEDKIPQAFKVALAMAIHNL